MTILLDTNVVSAMMRLSLEPMVNAWLGSERLGRLFVSAPSIFELRLGIESTPSGQRRDRMEASLAQILQTLPNRILSFDQRAADAAASARASQLARGITADIPDSQIAGIAICRNFRVATRNTKHFEGLGLRLINPWEP